MKFPYLKICLLIIAPFLLNSCDKNEAAYLQPTAYEEVDKELWYFFQRFEVEAEKRGLTIDLRALKISGSIEQINTDQIVGLCDHGAVDGKHVIIDADFWNKANDYEKEAILFHELGHCVLEREHTDGKLDNGMCESIMRSGFSNCITMYGMQDNVSYYLDELFEF